MERNSGSKNHAGLYYGKHVESLEEGKSYRLVDVGVRLFGGKKYLSFLKMSTKASVDDLDKVNEDDIFGEESEDSGCVVSGLISTVVSTAEYRYCKVCRAKLRSKMISLLHAPNAQQ